MQQMRCIMENNIYLVQGSNYSFTAYFAPTPPNENAIFLTKEGTYPVIYCCFNHDLDNNVSPIELKHCANQDELRIELNRTGNMHTRRIQKLWGYDYKKSNNVLLRNLNQLRVEYWQTNYGDSLWLDAFDAISKDLDLLIYWINSHYPHLSISEDEASILMLGWGNTLAIAKSGELIADEEGYVHSMTLQTLISCAVENAHYQIENDNKALLYQEVLRKMLHLEKKLYPTFDIIDEEIPY